MKRFLWLILFLWVFQVSAQTPTMINYQGRLLDGTNLVNGSVDLQFLIYTNEVGGIDVYASTNEAVVVDGLYSCKIGEYVLWGTLEEALSGGEAWLEVVVNGVALAPRERLLAVPYAYMAHRLGALRVETNETSPNLIGGASTNAVTGYGNVIGGGGVEDYPNRIFGNYGVIGGGAGNTIYTGATSAIIGGGLNNLILTNSFFAAILSGSGNSIGKSAFYALINGGANNTIDDSGTASVISGGSNNRIYTGAGGATIAGGTANSVEDNAEGSAISGGSANTIHSGAAYSAIAGGYNNVIQSDADYAFVAGGYFNIAGGSNSFAAGHGATASYDGTFAWADNSTNVYFGPSTNNQVAFRAKNGFGINTGSPSATLHVNGEAKISSLTNAAKFGMAAVSLNASGVVFVHPANTNFSMSWNASTYALRVSNNDSTHYLDVSMIVNMEGPSIASESDAVAPGDSLTLTNSTGGFHGGWIVTATRETQGGPGFHFDGSGDFTHLNGLITYWY